MSITWTWKDAGLIVLVFLVVYGLSIPLQFQVAELTGEMAQFNAADNPSIPESALIINHIGKAIGLLGGIAFVLYRKQRSWSALGFRAVKRSWLFWSIAIGVGSFPVRLLIARAAVAVMPELRNGAEGIFLNNDYSTVYNIFLLAIIVLVVPITEEIFYRGFIFTWMRQHHPLWAAVVFSSVFFAVSHLIPIQILMSFLLSLIITLVYHRTNTLWYAVAIHATNNLVSGVVALLATGLTI